MTHWILPQSMFAAGLASSQNRGDTGMSVVSTSEADEGFLANEHIAGLLERLRREPALRAWVLTAPTGALATLGVVLDDNELVQLLERIEELDERALPVTAADVMTDNPVTFKPETSVHE